MPFNSHVLAYYRHLFWTATTLEEVERYGWYIRNAPPGAL
jgi:hypothetical protein